MLVVSLSIWMSIHTFSRFICYLLKFCFLLVLVNEYIDRCWPQCQCYFRFLNLPHSFSIVYFFERKKIFLFVLSRLSIFWYIYAWFLIFDQKFWMVHMNFWEWSYRGYLYEKFCGFLCISWWSDFNFQCKTNFSIKIRLKLILRNCWFWLASKIHQMFSFL